MRRTKHSRRCTGPKGIDWSAQPLGLVPDGEIAEAVGCGRPAVVVARQARGIPAFQRPGRQVAYAWNEQPLGEVPDRQIAEALGCCTQAVHAARRRLGIASHAEQVAGGWAQPEEHSA